MTLALVHAELGAAYPVAGGTARFPYFAFGTLAGFTAGWAAYLQAVTIAPIEVEAAISYLNSTAWAQKHFDMLNKNGTLNGLGLLIASAAMLLFTVINLLGAKLLSDSNTIMVIWKAAVPILAVVVIMSLSFHSSNFTAGGGFAPYGAHGIFAALPAGVVFALQGFEQAVQMAGEARNPKKDISRAIISAMFIGAAVYILLEVAFIGGIAPHDVAHNWAQPDRRGRLRPVLHDRDRGGRGWLATILLVDAVISPGGTGLIYLGTSARLSYALGEEEVISDKLTETNRNGVPMWSIAAGLRARRDHLPAVPELEFAGRTGDRRDRDHVRVRARLARRAASARSGPRAAVSRAVSEGAQPGGVLRGEPDHLLGRLRGDVEAALRDLHRPGAVRGRAAPQQGRAPAGHRLAGRLLDLAVADRNNPHQPDRSLRRAQRVAELDRPRSWSSRSAW